MNNDVKIGTGNATGMFYHAPAGTPLPTSLAAALPAAWQLAGDITEDGITYASDKNTENLRNWAKEIKRVVKTEQTDTISAPIMDTTEETLKLMLGAENVTVTQASATHGKVVDAHLTTADLPEPEAFLFLMKDGDDLLAIGASRAQITDVADVNFAPGEGITWTATITGEGDGFHLILDDTQTTEGTMYALTSDETFQAGKTYYLRSGEAGAYTYTAATVVVGVAVPAATYYELEE